MRAVVSACLSADWPVYSIVKDRITRRSRLFGIRPPTARRDPPEAGKTRDLILVLTARGSRASHASFRRRPLTARDAHIARNITLSPPEVKARTARFQNYSVLPQQ